MHPGFHFEQNYEWIKSPIREFKGEYEFLSNFYPSPIKAHGIQYPTVEHYYQAEKAEKYSDKEWIAAALSPGEAKKRGRQVKMRDDWEEIKIQVMEYALREKFQNPELKSKLLATDDAILIEGNWWHDNIWGDCYCDLCQSKYGKNLLGKLLMQIRNEIRNNLN